jgi:hypothetical protein
MSNRHPLEARAFDPDLLRLARLAFDHAWSLHDADFPLGSPARDAARDALGTAIIDAVQNGERDVARVKQLGLGGLMRFRNRRSVGREERTDPKHAA